MATRSWPKHSMPPALTEFNKRVRAVKS